MQFNRLQLVQFECPRHWTPCVSPRLGPLGEIHFWCNKRLAPNGKKLEIVYDKCSLIGCNWSSLNARHSNPRVSFTFGEFFYQFSAVWYGRGRRPYRLLAAWKTVYFCRSSIKNGLIWEAGKEELIYEQNQLSTKKMVQFKYLRVTYLYVINFHT